MHTVPCGLLGGGGRGSGPPSTTVPTPLVYNIIGKTVLHTLQDNTQRFTLRLEKGA